MHMQSHISVLSETDIRAIHQASLTILQTVGMKFDDDRFLKALESRGAKVDYAARVARLPEKLLLETAEMVRRDYERLEAASSTASVAALPEAGDFSFRFGWCGGPAVFLLDHERREIRRGTAQDVIAVARLADALDEIQSITSTILIYGADEDSRPFHPRLYTLKSVALMAKHTRKVSYAENIYSEREMEYLEEMACVIKDVSDPYQSGIISTGKCVISPLKLERDACELLYHFIRRGYPCTIASMPIAGATAPVTLAGVLALANAEILGGWAAIKAVNPETRCGWCYYGACMNVRTGDAAYGMPEGLLTHVAISELCARLYRNAQHGIGSLYHDGKGPGMQAYLERGLYYLTGALSGYESLGHFGLNAVGQVLSLEGALLDLESAKWVRRFRLGLEVNSDTLALDTICAVGIGGNFMAEEHTAEHMRRELWQSDVFDRRTAEARLEEFQRRDLLGIAHERLRAIQAKHVPFELARDKAQALDNILKKAIADTTW